MQRSCLIGEFFDNAFDFFSQARFRFSSGVRENCIVGIFEVDLIEAKVKLHGRHSLWGIAKRYAVVTIWDHALLGNSREPETVCLLDQIQPRDDN